MKLSQLQEARYYKPSSSFAAFVIEALQKLNPGDKPKCLDEEDKVDVTELDTALEQLTDAFGPPGQKNEEVEFNYVVYQWQLGRYYVELFTYGEPEGTRYTGLCVSPEDNVNV